MRVLVELQVREFFFFWLGPMTLGVTVSIVIDKMWRGFPMPSLYILLSYSALLFLYTYVPLQSGYQFLPREALSKDTFS